MLLIQNSKIMKVFFLLLICLFSLLGEQLYAQTKSVLGTNRSWNYYSDNFHPKNDSCFILKDTIFNNKRYYEVYTTESNYPFCYVREDILSGKIWRVFSLENSINEVLVYDVSLSVGDTFHMGVDHSIVDSVTIINGKRHVYFDGPFWYMYPPFTFIEGIGAMANMFGVSGFEYFHSVMLCAYEDSLNVFTHDSIPFLTYNDSTLCKIDIYIGLNEYNEFAEELFIYPNPVTEISRFHIPNILNGEAELVIYNVMGQEILKKAINVSDLIHIRGSEYNKGIYFFKIKVYDKCLTGKFIKQ